jgi:hypothetical protein
MGIENGGFPTTYELFPRLTRAARFLGSLVGLPELGYSSDYPKHPRGAAELLDSHLDVVPFEPTDGEAISREG